MSTKMNNMKGLVSQPVDLDLADANVLDGSNVLSVPNHQDVFLMAHVDTETVASMRTELRPGRIIRFINGTAGANAVTFTQTGFASLTEGLTATDGAAMSVGDVKDFQQILGGGWVQISASNNT